MLAAPSSGPTPLDNAARPGNATVFIAKSTEKAADWQVDRPKMTAASGVRRVVSTTRDQQSWMDDC